MSVVSRARQDMEFKSRWHRTTRQTKSSVGTLVWWDHKIDKPGFTVKGLSFDRGLNKPCACGTTDKKTGRVLKFKRCCGKQN